MIPLIHNLTPESREILKHRIEDLFPESGIAGLYCRRVSRHIDEGVKLEIRCMIKRENRAVAIFRVNELLVEAMPVLVAAMRKCRAEHRHKAKGAAA